MLEPPRNLFEPPYHRLVQWLIDSVKEQNRTLGIDSKTLKSSARAANSSLSLLGAHEGQLAQIDGTAKVARDLAVAKNTSYYADEPPVEDPENGIFFKINDSWFDTSNDNRLSVWTPVFDPITEESPGAWVLAPLGKGALSESVGESLDKADQAAGELAEALLTPKPVTGLTEVSNTGKWSTGGPVAEVELSWNAVTESVDSKPVTITEYELLRDDVPFAKFTGLSGTITVPSGVAGDIRVRAGTAAGVWGELSTAVEVTGATPAVATSAPSDPVLTSGSGNVFAAWDGTYTATVDGAFTVRVEARITGDWLTQGTLTGANEQIVTVGEIGDTVEVRLVAYDQLGRETGVSATVSTEILGIDGDDIIVNTLQGNRIEVGTLQVDALEPNYGEKLNLYASEAIELIITRQDDQEAATADAQAAADDAANTAQAAAGDVSDLGDALTQVQGDVSNVSDVASAADAKATELGTVMRLTTDGLILGRPSLSAEMRMTPEGASLAQNGVTVSQWTAGRFEAPEAVLGKLSFANHQAEQFGPGRSVIKPAN